MSSFQRELLRKKLDSHEFKVPNLPPDIGEEADSVAPLGSTPPVRRRNSRNVPLKEYSDYFQQRIVVSTPSGDFTAYWSPPSSQDAPVFVFHHGMGSSGLSFAVLAKQIQELMANKVEVSAKDDDEVAGVLAFDMRGHGQSNVKSSDFSVERLVADFVEFMAQAAGKLNWGSPPLVLAGHSLGGSIVVKAALSKQIPNVRGVVVLDAVEELAVEALGSMQRLLSTWPKQFDSLDSAVNWHVSTHLIRNRESACVSVPNILTQTPQGTYSWTMDLPPTEEYWSGWFKGLSSDFLKAPAARLLILAGTDRLDKELMVGQMQGKYQLVVFNESGHYVQEDAPTKTALTLIDFWRRNGRPANIKPLFGSFR